MWQLVSWHVCHFKVYDSFMFSFQCLEHNRNLLWYYKISKVLCGTSFKYRLFIQLYCFVYHWDTHAQRNFANHDKIFNRLKARQSQLPWCLISNLGEKLQITRQRKNLHISTLRKLGKHNGLTAKRFPLSQKSNYY